MQGQLVYKYVSVKKEIKKCCSCHSFVSKDAKVCKRCGSSRFYVELQEYNLKIEFDDSGTILLAQSNIWDILKVLDDDYLISQHTRNKYEVSSKKRI